MLLEVILVNVKEQLEVHKCGTCGNMIETIRVGGGELVCCGKPMELMSPKTEEEGTEKHMPVIEKTENGYKVKVGSVPHPMEEEHLIEWIELVADGKACRKFLKAGDAPEAEFCTKADKVTAREHCNVHGLWKNEA